MDNNQLHTLTTQQGPSSRRTSWTSLLLGMLLLANGGLLAAWTTISRTPSAESSEVAFSRNMMKHHEQAVEMAEIVHERSQDPELRLLTLDILLTQQAQLGQMQGWLLTWGIPLRGSQSSMQGHNMMPGMARQDEVNALRSLSLPETEISFLQLMIRHHQGGVVMAQEELPKLKRAEVEQLATSIITAQENEIRTMQSLLEQRGATPLDAPDRYRNDTR